MINKKHADELIESIGNIHKNMAESIAQQDIDNIRTAFTRLKVRWRELEDLISVQQESQRG